MEKYPWNGTISPSSTTNLLLKTFYAALFATHPARAMKDSPLTHTHHTHIHIHRERKTERERHTRARMHTRVV